MAEREQLEQIIAALEAQPATLGNAAVGAALAWQTETHPIATLRRSLEKWALSWTWRARKLLEGEGDI
jgi:hypothetical protein